MAQWKQLKQTNQISVKFADALWQWLCEEAQRRDISRNQVIIQAVSSARHQQENHV
jgi:ribonuclease D